MAPGKKADWTAILAIGLIVFGGWLLLGEIAGPWFEVVREAVKWILRLAWPVGLILLGVLLLRRPEGLSFARPEPGRKLYRSRTDRRISGVLGGIAEFLGIDATLLRIAYVFLTIASGVGGFVITYIIAAFVIPEEPAAGVASPAPAWTSPEPGARETTQAPPPPPPAPPIP